MMFTQNIVIEAASIENAEEILELQKMAYQSEAELINDYTIPPLQQTVEEIVSEFPHQIILKVESENKIVGSVRFYVDRGTCYIGKLIVHPDYQNNGIGTRLLNEAEKRFPDVDRFELFTGQKSHKNLNIYAKNGYKIFMEKNIRKINFSFYGKDQKKCMTSQKWYFLYKTVRKQIQFIGKWLYADSSSLKFEIFSYKN